MIDIGNHASLLGLASRRPKACGERLSTWQVGLHSRSGTTRDRAYLLKIRPQSRNGEEPRYEGGG
jgi:hypothetical protein